MRTCSPSENKRKYDRSSDDVVTSTPSVDRKPMKNLLHLVLRIPRFVMGKNMPQRLMFRRIRRQGVVASKRSLEARNTLSNHILCGTVQIRFNILRHLGNADDPGDADLPFRSLFLSGNDLQKRGLETFVPSDKSRALPVTDGHLLMVEQHLRPISKFKFSITQRTLSAIRATSPFVMRFFCVKNNLRLHYSRWPTSPGRIRQSASRSPRL